MADTSSASTGLSDLGGIAAVAGIASPIIGGLMGASASDGDRAAAQAAYAKAYSQYDGLNIPDVQKQQLALQDPTVAGILQPYMQNAQQNQIQSNAMAGVQTDPRLQQAQMNALNTLSSMGNQGLNATDVAALNAANRQAAGQNQASQNSIMQNLAQRGAAGGGLELATRLAAAQNASDQASQQSGQIASQAQNRMLNAVAQAGQLGGQMQQTQFGQEAQKAGAANAIAQFNAQQAANVQNANTGAANNAQAANLSNAQNISNMGVATNNAQQQYNSQLLQQQFANQMSLAGAKANAAVGQATNFNNQGNAVANQYAGIGAGAGQGLMGVAALNKAYANGQNNAPTPASATPASATPGTDALLGGSPGATLDTNGQANYPVNM